MRAKVLFKGVLALFISVSFLAINSSAGEVADLYGDNLNNLASGWTVGTIDNDLEVANKLWRDHGFMAGSNVECSDGNVLIYVDEDGSKNFDGNDMPSEAGGIIYSLDGYETIVGKTFEVELELPAPYPSYSGISVAQTFGIFEKNPKRMKRQRGAFVNYGYCPGGVGDHHFSFGGKGEVIMKPNGNAMAFGSLDEDLTSIKLEIKSDSIEFSVNGEEPYYVQNTSPGELAGSDFELQIMTHAATVQFGEYEPTGAPYVTIIKSVKINGEEIPLTVSKF